MQPSVRPFVLNESLGRLVGRASRVMKSELNRSFAGAGLDVTADQWRVLVHLWDADGLTLAALCLRLIQEKTGVSRLVAGLVRRGYVFHEADPADGRIKRIRLTANGRRLQERLIGLAQGVIDRASADIPEIDLAVARRVLARIHDNLSPTLNPKEKP
jgi:DNA-binding MarR family transcriptional regulator